MPRVVYLMLCVFSPVFCFCSCVRYRVLCPVFFVPCSLPCVLCPVFFVPCSLPCVLCPVFSVPCSLPCVLCPVCAAVWILKTLSYHIRSIKSLQSQVYAARNLRNTTKITKLQLKLLEPFLISSPNFGRLQQSRYTLISYYFLIFSIIHDAESEK